MLKHLTARSNHWRTKAMGLMALRKSRLTGLPLHSRALTTEGFFSFGSSNQWGKEMNDDLTKSMLAKYFAREDGKTDSVATTLSPDVLASMVSEVTKATSKIDYKTVDMLVEQAIHAGSAYTGILETLIRFHMKSRNVVAAANVLHRCDPAKFAINEKLCMGLMSALVENCNWDHAFKTAIYMLYLDYDFPHNAIFFTVGGLNSSTAGVTKVLELIKVITLKKRSDLAQNFSFKRVTKFSTAMSGNGRAMRSMEALPAECIQDAMHVSLTQLRQSGWFEFSLAKMILALACAAGHEQIAANFVRGAFQACVDRGVGAQRNTDSPFHNPHKSYTAATTASAHTNTSDSTSSSSGGGDMDLLSLLRSFAQGDGIAERRAFLQRMSNTADYSPVTVALLQMCWEPSFAAMIFEQGPMRCMDLLNNYWVLAYRCRDVAIDLPESSQQIPFTVLEAVDAPTKELYDALMRFHNDRDVDKATFSPVAGFERRNFRILCDAFGYEHKLIPSPDDPVLIDIQVRKHYSIYDPTALRIEPPRYSELLRKDAKINALGRMIDNCPLFWPQAAAQLRAMSDEKLCVVAHRLLNAMANYPSPSWALLVVEILRERGIPLPFGTLRSIIKMCTKRDDIYSLLEVLHLAHTEQELSTTAEYQQKLHLLRNHSKYASNVSAASYMNTESSTHEEDEAHQADRWQDRDSKGRATGPQNTIDGLNRFDWNNACTLAFRSKHANVPGNSYQEIFTEMLQLMRKCNMELDGESIKTLLRFLLYTDFHSEHRWKLVQRLRNDASTQVTHLECVAMAYSINRRIQRENRVLTVNKSSYASPNYLHIFPNTLHKMSSFIAETALRGHLGSDFFTSYEIAWSRLHSATGRKELFHLVTDLLDSKPNEANAFVVSPNPEARDAVALMSIYAAYLLGCYDGEHRAAFTLLASVEHMYRQADRQQAEKASGVDGGSGHSKSVPKRGKSRRSAAYEAGVGAGAGVQEEGEEGWSSGEEAPAEAPRQVKAKQPRFEGRDLDMY